MVQDNSSLPDSDAQFSTTESKRHVSVLLVEDDRALRRLLQVVLERAGYKVVPATDGLEAMKLVLSQPIDAVVTDEIMPNLSGHEFCRFLRNSPTLSHLPVILLSALDRKDAQPNAADQADEFLTKPVSGERLIACIEKLLANNSS
ncbi:MAG: response regulator [Pyrinomonadaceae bacterium]